jgi:hypothetical protein
VKQAVSFCQNNTDENCVDQKVTLFSLFLNQLPFFSIIVVLGGGTLEYL